MNNFIQRTITGIIFVVLLVGCILYSPLSFGILFTIITALTVWEFSQLVNQHENITINPFITTIGGVYLFLAIYTYKQMMVDDRIFVPYLIILVYMLIRELYLKRPNPIHNWAFSFMSQLYVALPFALLNILAFQNSENPTIAEYSLVYTPILPLAIFIFNWSNDTGAYCIGVLFGRHRLFERISPKKSWEGSIGGAIICVIVSLIMAYFFPELTCVEWIGFALVVVVFGTWGDLVESLLKRTLGIKDSGHILPGHGGMLDRFDSTMLAVPAVIVYLYTLTLFS